MKHKIEKNTVQETLIIPLFARKVCSELYPNLYQDETSIRLIDEIDYDFSEAERKSRSLMQRFGSLEVAVRQNDLAWEARDYLKSHPTAAVVNLGCGLDSTGRACDNGSCKIYNLDFPDVIAVRNELLPAGEREENIPCNLNDTAWFSQIDASGGAVFFASGVFYYFLTEQVKAWRNAVETFEQDQADFASFAAIVRKYVGIRELTPTIVNEFVKKIIVHAPDKSSGHRRQKIELVWNFIGEVNLPSDDQTVERQRKDRTA